VAGGRGSRNRSRPRTRAVTAAAASPRSVAGGRLELSRLAPSGRSLLTGFLILATAVGLYAAARETSAFAVRQIAVEGTSPAVAADVRQALAPALGVSLLALDLDELAARARAVPMVSAASFDRGYPNTLRIAVVPEVPVAVLRQGASSWLAAEGGRVVGELDGGAHAGLPRIWLARDVDVRLGEAVAGLPLRAIATVAPLVGRPLPLRVTSVVATKEELTLRLRSGIELRLGNALDLAVKFEVARRILPAVAGEPGYLDVSVPDRPVAGTNAQAQHELQGMESPLP
jgi:cell division protein FtsQ